MSEQTIYLTPKGLAKRWEGVISLRTIYSWTQKPHRGPKRSSLTGGPVVYRSDDVEAFERTNARLVMALSQKGSEQ